MLWETHKRIAQGLAGELKLSSRETSQLEKGSIQLDYWKDYPHHYGKERQIRKNVIEAKDLFLNSEKFESLFRFGIALHYIQDSWVTVPGSSKKHYLCEDDIDRAPLVDDITDMVREFDLAHVYPDLSSVNAQEDKMRYLQINECLGEFHQLCQRGFENNNGRFVEDKTLHIATLGNPRLGAPIFDLNFAYRASLMVALSVYGPKTSSALKETLEEMKNAFEVKLKDAEEALAKKLIELNNKRIELKQKGGFVNWLKKLICDFNIWINRRRYERRSHLLEIQRAYYRWVERESDAFRNWYNVTIPRLDMEQVKRLLL